MSGTSPALKKNFGMLRDVPGVSEKSYPTRESTPSIRLPSSCRERVTNSSPLMDVMRRNRLLSALPDTHNLVTCRKRVLACQPISHEAHVVVGFGEPSPALHLIEVLGDVTQLGDHVIGIHFVIGDHTRRTTAILACYHGYPHSERFQDGRCNAV